VSMRESDPDSSNTYNPGYREIAAQLRQAQQASEADQGRRQDQAEAFNEGPGEAADLPAGPIDRPVT
jgi:hypothetical protein